LALFIEPHEDTILNPPENKIEFNNFPNLPPLGQRWKLDMTFG
jgi:hypothetical protein